MEDGRWICGCGWGGGRWEVPLLVLWRRGSEAWRGVWGRGVLVASWRRRRPRRAGDGGGEEKHTQMVGAWHRTVRDETARQR